ncbi:MAG: SDR family oxidoreductase [Proteobacteria bacterium]|nr:SDR family oxidoreductase [Pseudomonadota bacterium]
MDFTGKNIVITGAGAGVGKKAAEKFLEHGARVMINDLREDVLDQAEQYLKAKGEVVSFAADVTDTEAVRAMAQKAIETFGGVDIWLNNAGTAKEVKLFIEQPRENWDFDIGINLIAVLNGCKAILPHFIEKKAGKIVNTVSDAGRVGEFRLAVYSAAKAGVIGFTKALAREVGRYNIMVNCVSLGTTKTENINAMLEMMPGGEEKMAKLYALRRIGEMDDAANALLLMSSDYVTWITGQTLSSSGGFSFVS